MPQFTVVDLDEKLIDSAYPLVRTVAPEVSPERWSAYVHEARARGGMLGLIGEGSLFGFLSYRVDESLRHGRVLQIDDFTTFELSRAAPGRRALCEAAQAIARERGCQAIGLRVANRGYANDNPDKANGWASLGHSLEDVVFIKQLSSPTVPETGSRQVRERAST